MTAHKNIYIALSAAQSEMGPVVKGAVNPHFRSKYADLADVMQVALPALNKHGIAAWHSTVFADGVTIMRTTLSHGESDTHMNCDVPLIVAKNDMQGMKSATTYAKRIGIESLTGIAPEDDDGNAAAKAAPKNEARQQRKAPSPDAIQNAANYLAQADSLDDLRDRWTKLPADVRAIEGVQAAKDAKKTALEVFSAPQEQAPASADLGEDQIPY